MVDAGSVISKRKGRSGDWETVLKNRAELKRIGMSAGLDLTLPHRWQVVGSDRPFAETMAMLREVCTADTRELGFHPFEKGVFRPLTFRESIQARVAQFKELGNAGSLWTSWLDSCTAIVYQSNSTRFKVVPLSYHLLALAPSFRDAFVPKIWFNEFDSERLDLQNDVYDAPLTQEQVVKHEGWLAAVEGDKKLLKTYAAIVFALLKRDTAMPFWTIQGVNVQNQLRALCAGNLKGEGNCGGSRNLEWDSCFARICPL